MHKTPPWVGQTTRDVVRTVVVSPDTLFAEALSTALDRDGQLDVVGLARDSQSAVGAVESLRPTVLLADQRAVGPEFREHLGLARCAHPSLLVVLVSTLAPIGPGERATFDAVVQPQSSLDLVIATVREVAWYQDQRTGVDREQPGLSERELEVLGLLAGGVGTSAIAGRLHLSQHTVRNHVRRLTAKLGVISRGQAVAEAHRLGLL